MARDCPNRGGQTEHFDGEVQMFTGKVASIYPDFFFMESKPLQSNVYVSSFVADPILIKQGDVIEVKARWNAERSNWKAFGIATRDGAIIPPRSSAAPATTRSTVSLASSTFSPPPVVIRFGSFWLCAVHQLPNPGTWLLLSF